MALIELILEMIGNPVETLVFGIFMIIAISILTGMQAEVGDNHLANETLEQGKQGIITFFYWGGLAGGLATIVLLVEFIKNRG